MWGYARDIKKGQTPHRSFFFLESPLHNISPVFIYCFSFFFFFCFQEQGKMHFLALCTGFVSLLLAHYFAYYIVHVVRVERKNNSSSSSSTAKLAPPWLPYAIPGLGHSVYFMTEPFVLLKNLRYDCRYRVPEKSPFVLKTSLDIPFAFACLVWIPS